MRVGFLDRDGKPQEIEASGMLATCLQHEIDHLDGMLFIDYLSKLKRDIVIKKFKKHGRLSPKPDALSERRRCRFGSPSWERRNSRSRR